MLKICYLLPVYWPAIGGCELHTHELVKRLSKDHEIKVVTQITRQQDKPGNLWFGTLVHPIPKRDSYWDHRARVVPIQIHPLERVIFYPLVRFHHKMENLSMEAIGHLFARKVFKLLKGFDLVHCIHNGASFYAYTALKCAGKLGIPIVFTPLLQYFQALTEKELAKSWKDKDWQEYAYRHDLHFFLSSKGYHDRFWWEVCQSADALVTMTRFEKDFFRRHGIASKKIYEVGIGPLLSDEYNGVEFRKIHGIGRRKMVLFLGRKNATKGFQEVLKATSYVWEVLPETVFCFVGPKEGSAEAIFRTYKDPRIIELDEVSDYEKSSAVAACDVFCMPSFFEALGGVFLEAWMFEKPVIAGDTPPLRELIGGGQGGVLVKLDPGEIAHKIVLLLENEELCRRMGRWGKQKVLSQYAWEKIVAKMEGLYHGLIESVHPL